MLDYNEVDDPPTHQTQGQTQHERDQVRAALIDNIEGVLQHLLPAGVIRRNCFYIGNIYGAAGDSLEVVLTGPKAGLWTDRAEGTGGDLFHLIAGNRNFDIKTEFARVLEVAHDMLGLPRPEPRKGKPKKAAATVDELGAPTAKWDYLDAAGKLIAVVSRYEPELGRKEFRPWDVKKRRMAPPTPRPLYNQPGMLVSEVVILVEGEKCAQALIEAGYCATTAMQGANAPVDKTDWRPLEGKTVLIWPDKDEPGWNYAETAARAALEAGALSCDILITPDHKPKGWDAADALAEILEMDETQLAFDVEGFIRTGHRLPITREPDPSEVDTSAIDLVDGVNWSTEDGLAMAFTNRYGIDLRYCAQLGKWFWWNGKRWTEDKKLYVNHLARGICRAASRKADTPKLKARLASSSSISSVERIIRSDPKHAASIEEWDADPWLLNTPEGVVELKTGTLRPHQRIDRMTKITTASPKGECPQWRAFLEQITGGDKELEAYLQRMAGYCLTGLTSEHALLFLYGTGGNGKSVFVNTLFSIMGDYAANAPMETFMESRNDRHPTDLAGLMGARLVTATETEQGRRWNEAKIKEITGGDRISARFMRQDFFTYIPQYKILISGNHKPAIRNIDEAIKRRMHLIPFTLTIPADKRDPQLSTKLLKERDGILAWAIEGCLAWQREGLRQPPSVTSATQEYFESEDILGRWLDERCVLVSNAKSLTFELYNDWKQWADKNGEYQGSQRRFSDLLIAKGVERWRNSSGVRGFQGIGLKQGDPVRFTPHEVD